MGSDVEVDIAVIGAGLAGIAFARFFLDTHDSCTLLILEKDAKLGGVWSQDRIFDTFWCQSPLRQSFLSDRKLDLPSDAPTNHDMFEAKHVAQYLEEYVDNHQYRGRTIRDRMWLNSEVQGMEKVEASWILSVDRALTPASALNSTRGAAGVHVKARRVIVATGITSLPHMPAYLLDKHCPIGSVHHREFGLASPRILAPDSKYQAVTVMGGGKSAADLAYAAAKAGKNVHWLIRQSGEGPGMLLPAMADPYRHVGEAGNTLAATAWNPSAFKPLGASASCLHRSQADVSIVLEKLLAIDARIKAAGRFQDRPGALPGFPDLEPRGSWFWTNAPTGVPQHADFWDVVSRQVHIVVADVASVIENAIVLVDSRTIPTDIVLCGTGWSMDCPLLTPDQLCHLGLPHSPLNKDPCQDPEWELLLAEADQAVLDDYPILKRSIDISKRSMATTIVPGRLYRGIAPLTDDSILFLGRTKLANSFRGSEAQAIWATAYIDGNIRLPTMEARKRDVAYHIMFSKRRYPTRGGDGLNLYSDILWYTDQLVYESGLQTHRKTWWYDWTFPTLASDFEDCKDEYIRKYHGTATNDDVTSQV